MRRQKSRSDLHQFEIRRRVEGMKRLLLFLLLLLWLLLLLLLMLLLSLLWRWRRVESQVGSMQRRGVFEPFSSGEIFFASDERLHRMKMTSMQNAIFLAKVVNGITFLRGGVEAEGAEGGGRGEEGARRGETYQEVEEKKERGGEETDRKR